MPRPAEMKYLERCIALATEALEAGDQPFGSVLVSADGEILFEDHSRTASGDATRHPEFEIARWAARNMDEKARAATTVLYLGRTLSHVCSRSRLGGAGPHCLHQLFPPAGRLDERTGRPHSGGSGPAHTRHCAGTGSRGPR